MKKARLTTKATKACARGSVASMAFPRAVDATRDTAHKVKGRRGATRKMSEMSTVRADTAAKTM